ncbi:PAQR family membrane homeostasis protein TrhA [Streptosporangium saharense]|uniref:PAQR family membrane homeostasis protein TrhA n=1 Tax=Streptosporangium saharense TaxID=1706840 RepID=UPI003321ACF7
MTTTTAGGFPLPGPAKPRLRGWLHAGALPVALIAGFVLVALGPTFQARLAAAVYAVTSGLLFGVSATYHRGALSPRLAGLLRRLDHANIYLIIAGTHTPFAMLALDGLARTVVLTVVWTGAVAGVLFKVLWTSAPRWLSTALYIALGWTAVFVLPQLLTGAGVLAVSLVLAGGLLYTAGGVVYGMRRPDPSPRWFGFHEVFHALTVAAYVVQYAAVFLVVRTAA